MQTTRMEKVRRSSGERTGAGSRLATLLAAGQLMAWVGCGPATEAPHVPELAAQVRAIESGDGTTAQNGRPTLNGISMNGISMNGISMNGLTPEAIDTARFAEWFKTDPEQNDIFMRYVVRCGVRAQKTLAYTDSATGQVYTWEGLLGLTPSWAKGHAISETEEQLLTACLAAHANKYGVHISISVLGRNAKGQKIKFNADELATYSRREGCFFGNIFQDEGLYVGADQDYLDPSESTARACGLTSGPDDMSSECPPMIHVGSCESVCQLDRTGTYYTSCTYNGRTYLPITTRLLPQDVYRCGDGVCQFTERCGDNDTWDSCYADCGACQP